MSDYRTMSDQLELILAKLESGELDVDQAIEQYQKGMELVKQLEKQLKLAENKVQKVKADFSAK
jgi:exodeoxyribonuclease VII small subunit